MEIFDIIFLSVLTIFILVFGIWTIKEIKRHKIHCEEKIRQIPRGVTAEDYEKIKGDFEQVGRDITKAFEEAKAVIDQYTGSEKNSDNLNK